VGNDDRNNHPKSETPYQVITAECDVMLRYVMGLGRSPGPAVVEDVAGATAWVDAQARELAPELLAQAHASAPTIAKLSKTHQRLAKAVAPAEPRSLRLMHAVGSTNLWLRMPMPRNMTIVAMVSIVVLIAVGTSPLISADPADGNPLLSSGPTLLLNQLFFLSIASLGACFHGLFKVNEYVVGGTYDPIYAATYWVRYLLGLISGVILASLISVEETSAMYTIARPVLALVGGFSSSVVHRILDRLVATVEGLFTGDPKKRADEQQRVAQVEMDTRIRDARVDAATALMKLQAKLHDGITPELARAEIGQLLGQLLPASELESETPSGASERAAKTNGAVAEELGAISLAAEPGAGEVDPVEPPN
jgi:hypothetical protein